MSKRPVAKDWNKPENLITTTDRARRIDSRSNLGMVHAKSGTVSLDGDQHRETRSILKAEGVDLDAILQRHATVIGRSARVEFAAPAGVDLHHQVLRWPARPGDNPLNRVCIFEFRAGWIQDVVPPSMHPNTQKPYRWLHGPPDRFRPLPDELLSLWLDWDQFKYRARNACPWAPEEEVPPARSARAPFTGRSVIAAFNDAHDVTAILERHGYRREGRRFRSPVSSTHAAGICLREDGRVICYHASDALGDGRPHDAFDLFTQLDFAGNVSSAVKAAARMLGINHGAL